MSLKVMNTTNRIIKARLTAIAIAWRIGSIRCRITPSMAMKSSRPPSRKGIGSTLKKPRARLMMPIRLRYWTQPCWTEVPAAAAMPTGPENCWLAWAGWTKSWPMTWTRDTA